MDKIAWEERYATGSSERIPAPADLLSSRADLIVGGKALDIAMGSGRNALFLARQGCEVTGVEQAGAAVELARRQAEKQGLHLSAVETDVHTYDIAENGFDIITDFYFLERDLIPCFKKGLKKNGLIFFETYTLEQQQFGRPANPAFLLKPNELLNWFLDYFIIFYHERIEEERAVASLIAQKV